MQYRVIYADPPWPFTTRSPKGAGKSPSQHYDTMTVAEIEALPVADWAAKDSVLLLWVSNSLSPESFAVITSWGFTYKTTGFVWIKNNRTRPGFGIGCGYYTARMPSFAYWLNAARDSHACTPTCPS